MTDGLHLRRDSDGDDMWSVPLSLSAPARVTRPEPCVGRSARSQGPPVARHARGAGYETETCGGPQAEPCPVIEDLPCPLVDRADVLVYDAWVAGGSEAGHRLVSELREIYADLPVVLTSVDGS